MIQYRKNKYPKKNGFATKKNLKIIMGPLVGWFIYSSISSAPVCRALRTCTSRTSFDQFNVVLHDYLAYFLMLKLYIFM